MKKKEYNPAELTQHTVTVLNLDEALILIRTLFGLGFKDVHMTRYEAYDDKEIFNHTVYEITY